VGGCCSEVWVFFFWGGGEGGGLLDLPAVMHVSVDLLKFKHTQHHKGEKFLNEMPAH